MMTDNRLIKLFKNIYTKSGNLNEGIKLLKQEGAKISDIVFIVKKTLGITLKEADTIVLNSEAFSKEKNNINKFRESFFDELDSFES